MKLVQCKLQICMLPKHFFYKATKHSLYIKICLQDGLNLYKFTIHNVTRNRKNQLGSRQWVKLLTKKIMDMNSHN